MILLAEIAVADAVVIGFFTACFGALVSVVVFQNKRITRLEFLYAGGQGREGKASGVLVSVAACGLSDCAHRDAAAAVMKENTASVESERKAFPLVTLLFFLPFFVSCRMLLDLSDVERERRSLSGAQRERSSGVAVPSGEPGSGESVGLSDSDMQRWFDSVTGRNFKSSAHE